MPTPNISQQVMWLSPPKRKFQWEKLNMVTYIYMEWELDQIRSCKADPGTKILPNIKKKLLGGAKMVA